MRFDFHPILFFPRSGSTVVDHCLDQRPDLLSINEPMNTYRLPPDELRKIYDLTFKQFIDPFILQRIKASNKNIVCFQHCPFDIKHFMDDINYETYFQFIKTYFKSIVVIRRKNLLKQLVSYHTARTSSTWHIPQTSMNNRPKIRLDIVSHHYRTELMPCNIDPSENIKLVDYLQEFQKSLDTLLATLDSSNIPTLDLVYEEHIQSDPMIAIRMIEDFWNLSRFDGYKIPFQRLSRGLKDDLENYQEVYDHLRSTEFEWMLEDDE